MNRARAPTPDGHPHPQVVEETLVQNYRRHTRGDEPVLSAQNGFLTTDY